MKSTVIYEKKNITVGEIISSYGNNLIWFLILIVNFSLNYFFDSIITKRMESNIYDSNTISYMEMELLSDKFIFSRNLIYAGFLINTILIFVKKNINSLIPNYIIKNNIHNFIPILFYLSSSLIYKTTMYYVNYFQINKELEQNEDLIINLIIVLYYMIFEIVSVFTILISLLYPTLKLLFLMSKAVYNFYNTEIKDISFEYIDKKIIQIDKIV